MNKPKRPAKAWVVGLQGNPTGYWSVGGVVGGAAAGPCRATEMGLVVMRTAEVAKLAGELEAFRLIEGTSDAIEADAYARRSWENSRAHFGRFYR